MKTYFQILLLLLSCLACKEKYVLPEVAPASGYLVVEGNINSGGATNIALTRTNTLIAQNKIVESGAQVTVESDDNSAYILPEKTIGNYNTELPLLNTLNKYRLHIRTANGKEYLSDFVTVKQTPPIDSISWIRESGGVRMYVNAHDDLNNTKYYLWDYEETWEFRSDYLSVLAYDLTDPANPVVVYKDPVTHSYDKSIYACWSGRSSTNLLIGSTAQLTQDRVYLPINFVPNAAKEISFLYSIKVNQYALSKAAYEFLDKMKKNTESTGSIFDAQPSALKGNIHSIADADEPVIGFVNISSHQEKRIFISNSQLLSWGYRSGCRSIEVINPDSIASSRQKGFYFPTDVATSIGNIIMSFNATDTRDCFDCTLTGSNVKPSFWP